MRDVERMLVQLACLRLNIVPVDHPEHAVADVLAKMPPEEALKARRKFRKVWRCAFKTKQRKNKQGRCLHVLNEMRHRRYIVLNWLLRQMKPMLDSMPSVDNEHVCIRGPPT